MLSRPYRHRLTDYGAFEHQIRVALLERNGKELKPSF